MIEKDTIQELFSKTFENHSAPVKPELWAGVQAKMSAASAAGGAAAAKGLSAFAKWAIGSAALTGAAVVTTLAVLNSGSEAEQPKQAQQNNAVQTENKAEENATKVDSPANMAANNPATPNLAPTIRFVAPVITDRYYDGPEDQLELSAPISWVDSQKTGWTTPTLLNPEDNSNIGTQSSSKDDNLVGKDNSNAQTPQTQGSDTKTIAPAKIELPNVFTPNGDGANDKYEFITIENVKSIDIAIYDSNGKLVFKWINDNELKFSWDGTILDSGDQAPEGIYSCQIAYRDLSDMVKTKTSYIYLKRKAGF